MEKRKLGNSDLAVSVISLGAWSYGKVPRWGVNVDENEVVETVHKAVDFGINLIDTAPGYGESEKIVGKALKGIRDKFFIATKCGADPQVIPNQIDNSLKNIGIDYVDLYQVHYPRKEIPIADTIGTLEKLKGQGKIRYIGVSNFSVEQLKEAIKTAPIVSCQSPYNLVWREIEENGVLDFCCQNRIGILTYSSLAQGLLTGKFRSRKDLPDTEGETRRDNVLFKEGIFEEGLKIVEVVRNLAKKYKRTPAQVSLNWVIHQKGITSALMGARNISQLDDNVKAAGWKLDEEDMATLSEKKEKLFRLLDYTCNMWGVKY